MQIVIDIDEETYADIKKGKVYSSYRDVPLESVLAIASGTPLPKGHGRLIDKDHVIARLEVASNFYGGENADAFDERFSYGLKEAEIKVCEEPTIIEADIESEE